MISSQCVHDLRCKRRGLARRGQGLYEAATSSCRAADGQVRWDGVTSARVGGPGGRWRPAGAEQPSTTGSAGGTQPAAGGACSAGVGPGPSRTSAPASGPEQPGPTRAAGTDFTVALGPLDGHLLHRPGQHGRRVCDTATASATPRATTSRDRSTFGSSPRTSISQRHLARRQLGSRRLTASLRVDCLRTHRG